jgi:putative acetyltransferase
MVSRLIQPDTPDLWAAAKQLIEDYAASLEIDLAFQNFQDELKSLEHEYSPPDGALLLAEQNGEYVGCVALRKFTESACEMKRLYVAPGGRGRGIGRALAEGVIAVARKAGYQRMLLDTLSTMKEALTLYDTLGFKPIGPYRFNPIAGAVYLELKLEFRKDVGGDCI